MNFTINEQNCLAELCTVMSSISHTVNTKGIEPTPNQIYDLAMLVEKFPNISWGDLYDKFHRQGKNAE